jgi:hypothetical protein
MANSIVAGNSSNGGTAISTDTSGTLNIVTGSGSGATAVTVDGSQNLSFNSGYGSAAVAYGCRAWVNFNGTSTVSIRASGNVSSITDNGTGDYTLNFATTMPDTNYSSSGFGHAGGANYQIFGGSQSGSYVANTSSLRCQFGYVTSTGGSLTNQDPTIACVQIFR